MFDPYALLEALDRERVSYVVVGGFARVVHGSGETTHGLDIVPSLRPENLRRLARALEGLGGTGADGGPIRPDALVQHGDVQSRDAAPAASPSFPSLGVRAATTTSASAATARTSAGGSARTSPRSST